MLYSSSVRTIAKPRIPHEFRGLSGHGIHVNRRKSVHKKCHRWFYWINLREAMGAMRTHKLSTNVDWIESSSLSAIHGLHFVSAPSVRHLNRIYCVSHVCTYCITFMWTFRLRKLNTLACRLNIEANCSSRLPCTQPNYWHYLAVSKISNAVSNRQNE